MIEVLHLGSSRIEFCDYAGRLPFSSPRREGDT